MENKKITQQDFEMWHSEGDCVVIEKIQEICGDTSELSQIHADCFAHDCAVKGGEPYGEFKDRYMSIVEKYIKGEE